MPSRLTPALLAAAAAALALVGLVVAGRQAADYLRTHPRYRPPFATANCPAPPGRERTQFLEEVQYLSSLPDRVDVLDPETPARLRAAFERHPCVARVESLAADVNGIRVVLAWRVPVLTVRGWPGSAAGESRAVDACGVVLPRHIPADGLPEMMRPATAPSPPGDAWPDPGVLSAARLAGWLAPHRGRLGVTRLEPDGAGGWTVWRTDGSVVAWGPVSDGSDGGREAEERLARLAGLTGP